MQKINRMGEIGYNNQGLKMRIIKYNNCQDIDIQFEDGTIIKNREYSKFKKGEIKNPNSLYSSAKNRVNETNLNTQGTKMTIIKYKNNKDITVCFEDGYIAEHVTYKNFQNGTIFNPYCKNIYNIGYFGVGKYKSRINNIETKEYSYWYDMLKRCYDEKYQNKNISYKGCSVCEEWHNFQNFAKWFNENYYEVDNERMELDKDILFKGNKVYSPNTCIFVPHRINSLFVKCTKKENNIGIFFNKDTNKYVSKCKKEIIGYYKERLDAFNAYKEFKENYIKEIANDYKDKIPKKLYDAMYNWTIGE